MLLLLSWRPLQLGWRPSLLGWRPPLLGWRPSLLETKIKEKSLQVHSAFQRIFASKKQSEDIGDARWPFQLFPFAGTHKPPLAGCTLRRKGTDPQVDPAMMLYFWGQASQPLTNMERHTHTHTHVDSFLHPIAPCVWTLSTWQRDAYD